MSILPLWVLALSLAQLPGNTPAPPPPLVQLATAAPGPTYWESYGHNSLVIRADEDRPGISYNYGIFDFRQENFLLRFLAGRMLYRMAAFDADEEAAGYLGRGRPILLQTLNLTPAEAWRLVEYLQTNAEPANRDYRYDYFLSNCSTKIRDALDHALDGRLQSRFGDVEAGVSFRRLARTYSSVVPWMDIGSSLALGRPTDRPISEWESFYIPDRLAAALETMTGSNGQPLVTRSQTLGAARAPLPSAPLWPWLAGGILLAAAAWLLRRRPGLTAVGWVASGLVGLLLCGLLLTDHWAARWNENILVFSPLGLVLGFLLWTRRPPGPALLIAAALVPLCALLLKLLPGSQQNLEFLALALPPQLVGLFALSVNGKHRTAGQTG